MKAQHAVAVSRLLSLWLTAVARVVPRGDRVRWREEWIGELRYGLTGRPSLRKVTNIAFGMLSDARDVRRSTRVSRSGPTQGDSVFHQVLNDLRFAIRTIRRAPLFTVVVFLTIGLGVGATTALFTVVNSVLLDPLPFADAERLVNLWQGRRAMGIDRDWFSGPQYVDIRDGTDVFENMAFGGGGTVTITGDGPPVEAGYAAVTSSFFAMLGITPALGRILDASDDVEGAARVVLLSHELWQTRFGGDSSIVGQTITINNIARKIVGVLPSRFSLTQEVLPTVGGRGGFDLIGPLQMTEARLTNRGSENYNIVAKLKPGVSVEQAQAQLDVVAQTIIEQHEENTESGFFISAVPLLEDVVGTVRRPLLALLIAGIVLLLIACTNVVNLLLARSAKRGHELSIRAAMGARRHRLVRQLLTESMLLAVLGCLAGLFLATAGLSLLRRMGPASLPRLSEISVDGSVLLFGFVLVTITTLAFGLIPALRASHADPNAMIRSGGRGDVGGAGLRSKFNLSSALVVVEIALALLLLVGAGLLVRSFRAIQQVDPGFVADNVMTFRLRLLGDAYRSPERRVAFLENLSDELQSLPDVRTVGGVHLLPFTRGATWGRLNVEDNEHDGKFIAHFRVATPRYFDAMRIPLIQGRLFDRSDRLGNEEVVVVEQQIAARLFPGENPIGKRIEGWTSEGAEIIGVVGSVKIAALEEDAPLMAYYPASQVAPYQMYYTVRGNVPEAEMMQRVEQIIRRIDPQVLLADVTPMGDRVNASLASRRFAMTVFELFGMTAMILAIVGVYGLMAYRVNLGTRELGMRLALGARQRDVVWMVVRHGMTLAIAGMALGMALSLGVTRLMGTMLFNVEPADIVTLVAVTTFLGAISLLACWIPARRAALADPVLTLRGQ